MSLTREAVKAQRRAEIALNPILFGGQRGTAHDCTPAFTAMKNELAITGGGVVEIPPGIWRLTSDPGLSVSNVTWVGQGIGVTLIYIDYGTVTTYGLDLSAASGSLSKITFSGISFYSNNVALTDNRTPADPFRLTTHATNTITDITWEDCEFYHFALGPMSGSNSHGAAQVRRITFEHNIVRDIGTATMARGAGASSAKGFGTNPPMEDSSVSFNRIYDIGDTSGSHDADHAIYLSRTFNRGRVIGNVIYNDSNHLCDGVDAREANDCTIALNTIQIPAQNALNVGAGGGNTFIGNTALSTNGNVTLINQTSVGNRNKYRGNVLDTNGKNGCRLAALGNSVDATGGVGWEVTGNTIYGGGNSTTGIEVTNNFLDGLIQGNHVYGTAGTGGATTYGVLLEDGATSGRTIARVKVLDNIFDGVDIGVRTIRTEDVEIAGNSSRNTGTRDLLMDSTNHAERAWVHHNRWYHATATANVAGLTAEPSVYENNTGPAGGISLGAQTNGVIVRRNRNNASGFVEVTVTSGATIALGNDERVINLDYASPTTVTAFSGSFAGQEFWLKNIGANTVTIQHSGGTIELQGSANFAMATGAALHLVRFNGVITEVGRSTP